MNGSCALTTFDNPYDPFERFSDWFLFDVGKGYNTCSYLARIAKTSEQFSDEENEQENAVCTVAGIEGFCMKKFIAVRE